MTGLYGIVVRLGQTTRTGTFMGRGRTAKRRPSPVIVTQNPNPAIVQTTNPVASPISVIVGQLSVSVYRLFRTLLLTTGASETLIESEI